MTEQTKQPFAKLKRFVEPQPKPRSRENCEFCGAEIAEQHSHAVNTETRSSHVRVPSLLSSVYS